MINDWNAIDLHMHTCTGVTGDGNSDTILNFTYKNYISALATFNIKLAAITNHNIINIANYLLCRCLAKKIGINILFGVEIDTNRETGENYHFVAIFEESLERCVEIAKKINDSTEQKQKAGDKVRYSPAEIVGLIKNYNVIIIPHGDKSKGLLKRPTEEQIIDALKKVRDGFIRVFDSPSDWKLERIKELIESKNISDFDDNFGGVLFSDNRDWKNYGNKFRNFYMNAEPTFRGLLHSITNPEERFATKDLIPTKSSYISKIVIKKKNSAAKIDNCTIELDDGYNCIIGKSGSGKSLLSYLIAKGTKKGFVDDDNYAFAQNNQVVIYDELGHEISPDAINVGIGEKIFDKIITASSTKDAKDMYSVIGVLNKDFQPKSKFSEYITKYSNYLTSYREISSQIEQTTSAIKTEFNSFLSANKDLKELKDVNSFSFEIPDDVKLEYSDDSMLKIKEIFSLIKSIELAAQYFNGDSKANVLAKISELKTTYLSEMKKILIDDCQNKLKNKKRSIVKKALSIVNDGISSNAKRKTEILGSMAQSISNIVLPFLKLHLLRLGKTRFDLSIKKSEIDRKGELVKNSQITYSETINDEIISKLDIKQNFVFNTKTLPRRKVDSKIYDMASQSQSKEVIDCYLKQNLLSDQNIKKIFNNVTLDVEVFFKDQNVKELNPGDIAKTYIDTYFTNELANGKNTVILYDQIENDVDKPFISGPLVKDIAKMKKRAQLIIVTHDPIVAVNADPINYIEAIKNENGVISYRSFKPESYERDELSTIAKCVDGSKTVIRERYEIYKGDKTYAED